jgi:hypothetical protein
MADVGTYMHPRDSGPKKSYRAYYRTIAGGRWVRSPETILGHSAQDALADHVGKIAKPSKYWLVQCTESLQMMEFIVTRPPIEYTITEKFD